MTKMDKLLDLIRVHGIVRAENLRPLNIPVSYLPRLQEQGKIERLARGLYSWPGAEMGVHQSVIEAVRQVPRGVVCLLTALSIYELGTQQPHEIWLALPSKAWRPCVEYPPVRLVHFSELAFHSYIQTIKIHQQTIRIYSVAKTVADCFKYRNKLGLDIALEALRDCWRKQRATMKELWQAAEVCRMTRVMRPYLESLV